PRGSYLEGWHAMIDALKPATRPRNPHFSSGPCAKPPGWRLDALSGALVGRSHRSTEGKARLQQLIELTRELLRVPDGHRIGIVPASDTGAFEMALWSLVGPRGVDALAWDSFGKGWVRDLQDELKVNDLDRKSTRLNSSHVKISYAVFCL